MIDEAYHEFAGQSVVPLLNEHENLIVLRTFSKAMAFAALRVGYLLAAPDLVREIRKAVLPYNLNAFSQIAAEVAIEKYESELASAGEADHFENEIDCSTSCRRSMDWRQSRRKETSWS